MIPSWCGQVNWGNCGIPWVNCAVMCVKDDWKRQFWGLRYCPSKLRSLLSFFPSGITSHSKVAQFNWECIWRLRQWSLRHNKSKSTIWGAIFLCNFNEVYSSISYFGLSFYAQRILTTDINRLKAASVKFQSKCDVTRWGTVGEVKGKLANGLGSQYPSHYLGTWCIQHYYSLTESVWRPLV